MLKGLKRSLKMNHKQKTPLVKKEEAQKSGKNWFIFDATGKTLGRFASEIAKVLKGKHRMQYTPNVDTGDGVIVIHANKIKVTGAKDAQKEYCRYSGTPGGLKTIIFKDLLVKKPEDIILLAVKGMMPKTKLGRKQMKSLRVFSGTEHKMQAQKPTVVNL